MDNFENILNEKRVHMLYDCFHLAEMSQTGKFRDQEQINGCLLLGRRSGGGVKREVTDE